MDYLIIYEYYKVYTRNDYYVGNGNVLVLKVWIPVIRYMLLLIDFVSFIKAIAHVRP